MYYALDVNALGNTCNLAVINYLVFITLIKNIQKQQLNNI